MTLVRVATMVTTIVTDSGSNTVTIEDASVSYDTDISQDLSIPANTVQGGASYNVSISSTNLVMFGLGLDQADGDTGEPGFVTVYLVTAGGPGPALVLTMQNGLSWVKGDIMACPLSSPVISITVVNPNSANMVLHVRAGVCSAACI